MMLNAKVVVNTRQIPPLPGCAKADWAARCFMAVGIKAILSTEESCELGTAAYYKLTKR
jgi:hypothetical protein